MKTLHAQYKKKRRRGTTLMELMVAVSISSIALSGVYSLYVSTLDGLINASQFNAVSRSGNRMAMLITRDFRSAVGFVGSFSSGGDSYDNTNSLAILQIPSIDADENVIDVENTFDHVVYYPVDPSADPIMIMRQLYPDGSSSRQSETLELGNGDMAIQPDALGAFVINYQFSAESNRAGHYYSMPVSGSVRLRNKR